MNMGYGLGFANHLPLIACFISSKKRVQKEKYPLMHVYLILTGKLDGCERRIRCCFGIGVPLTPPHELLEEIITPCARMLIRVAM